MHETDVREWLQDTRDDTRASREPSLLDIPRESNVAVFASFRPRKAPILGEDSSIIHQVIPTKHRHSSKKRSKKRRTTSTSKSRSVSSTSIHPTQSSRSASDSDSSSSVHDKAPFERAHPYERRPRRKTRKDKYETKSKDKTKQDGKDKHKDRSHCKRSKRTRRSAPARPNDLIRSFHAKNVANARLTLQPSLTAGLYQQGRASVAYKGRGLPDLVFSEMNFLKKRHLEDPAPPAAEKVKESSSAKRRRQDRRRVEEQDISAFFQSGKEHVRQASQDHSATNRPTHVGELQERIQPQTGGPSDDAGMEPPPEHSPDIGQAVRPLATSGCLTWSDSIAVGHSRGRRVSRTPNARIDRAAEQPQLDTHVQLRTTRHAPHPSPRPPDVLHSPPEQTREKSRDANRKAEARLDATVDRPPALLGHSHLRQPADEPPCRKPVDMRKAMAAEVSNESQQALSRSRQLDEGPEITTRDASNCQTHPHRVSLDMQRQGYHLLERPFFEATNTANIEGNDQADLHGLHTGSPPFAGCDIGGRAGLMFQGSLVSPMLPGDSDHQSSVHQADVAAIHGGLDEYAPEDADWWNEEELYFENAYPEPALSTTNQANTSWAEANEVQVPWDDDDDLAGFWRPQRLY